MGYLEDAFNEQSLETLIEYVKQQTEQLQYQMLYGVSPVKEPKSMQTPTLFYAAVPAKKSCKYEWAIKGLTDPEEIVKAIDKLLKKGYTEDTIKTCFVSRTEQAVDKLHEWSMNLLNSTIPGGMCAPTLEEGARMSFERGYGGDHDVAYMFEVPKGGTLLRWGLLVAAYQRGELD